MNISGYSAASKERAKEQIENLKERNKQEIFIRKQKIRQLSTQTNKIRRKLEESKKHQEDEEEKRRLRILKMRKIRQDSATEKFQRTPDKKRREPLNTDAPINTSGLRDGNYSVGNHVIEIRDGKRVNSTRSNSNDTPQHIVTNSKFQNSLYDPKLYLNNHVRDLFNGDSGSTSGPLPVNSEELITTPFNGYHDDDDGLPKSPTDSVCSNDSLVSSESPSNKLLRSSLKSSNIKMTDSLVRKVTFSDSVEFNDGDTKPIFTTVMAARVPLYKRIEQRQANRNDSKAVVNHQPISQSLRKANVDNDIQTTEQLLDQLRQEALLPKYPENEDFSYPDSVEIRQHQQQVPIGAHVLTQKAVITEETNTKTFTDSLSADSLSVANIDDSIDSIDDVDIETPNENTINNVNNSIRPHPFVIPISDTSAVTYIPKQHQIVKTGSQNHALNSAMSTNNRPENTYPLNHQAQSKAYKKIGSDVSESGNDWVYSEVEIKPISSDVVKIHADTVNPYLSNIVKNSNINFNEDKNPTECHQKDNPSSRLSAIQPSCDKSDEQHVDSLNTNDDTLFKDIEASLASVTFENVIHQYMKGNEADMTRRPINKPKPELCSELQQDYPESEKITNAIKDGTSIPVRVHSGKVRRGRIIVSANEKKRRQIGNFTPHPPPKAKYDAGKSSNDISFTKTLPSNSKPLPKKNLNANSNRNSPRRQTMKVYTSPRQNSVNKNNNKTNSPRIKTNVNKNRSPVHSPRTHSSPSVTKPSPYQSKPSLYQPQSPQPAQNLEPYHIHEIGFNHNHYNKSNNQYNDYNMNNNNTHTNKNRRMSLDKTPTDDEINTLWQDVRDCLSSDIQEHAYSDTACHVEQKRYHQRTLSGSLIRRSNNYPHYNNTRDQVVNNKRYGSHETLYRPSSNDSFGSNASSFTKRQALLTHRTSRILSPKLITDNNNNTYFRRKTINSKQQNNSIKQESQNTEVSESMATFLALEELCGEQSLTPSQTEAVFKASKSLMRKQNPETVPSQKGMSALSIEEQRVMKSLDRINEKLKRQDHMQKTLTSKRR